MSSRVMPWATSRSSMYSPLRLSRAGMTVRHGKRRSAISLSVAIPLFATYRSSDPYRRTERRDHTEIFECAAGIDALATLRLIQKMRQGDAKVRFTGSDRQDVAKIGRVRIDVDSMSFLARTRLTIFPTSCQCEPIALPANVIFFGMRLRRLMSR